MEDLRASLAPLQRQATTNEESITKNKIRKENPRKKKSKAHAVAAVASPPSAGIVP